MRTRSFVKENPKAGDINNGMIAHGNDKSRNMDIQDIIALLCYYYRVELSMHSFGSKACTPSEVLDSRKLMEHPSAKDAVLTLGSVSPGSGVLHQEF